MTRYTTLMLFAILGATVALTGCVSKEIYRDAAQSGWTRWEEDHKPVVPDEEFSAMTPDQQELHMSATREAARKFERDEALGLLKD